MMGSGSRIVISTSKIKKMIAIRKNRKEKGIRLEEKGSNPHSNGDAFSRLDSFFILKRVVSRIRVVVMIRMIVVDVIIMIIISLM